ncbi:MAG: 4Fe-4S dicluster domain-containing protein, partial [bacterium]
ALVENEGNARMVTTLPRLHIMFLTPEKILPGWDDLWLFLTLLIRSATGQRLSSYISILPGRSEDSVKRVAILVDNGRSRLLDDPFFRTILRCIRCGACLNFCPVYRSVGGHTYPWVIAGPIGAILSPALVHLQGFGDLAFASTLCGACSDVCPVRIPFTDFLHHFRTRQKRRSIAWIYRIFFWLYSHPRNYRLLHFLLRVFPHSFFESQQVILSFPLFQNWIQGRSALIPAPKSFYTLWKERTLWQKPSRKTS